MRIEEDSLGEMELDEDAYYGIQTARAIQNFSISNQTLEKFPKLIWSMAAIKKAVALTNHSFGRLDADVFGAIMTAADEIMAGKMKCQFPVDIYHAGGGVSLNMNINEVIANRANELITGYKGYEKVHPNNHVNLSQSTNDIFPSAIKVACYRYIEELLEVLEELKAALKQKENDFSNIVKVARTCLQDAVPITLGQQFSGYHSFICRQISELESLKKDCAKLVIGATAVGTGIGTFPGYTEKVYPYLQEISGILVKKEENFFDGLQNADTYLKISSSLKGLATGLSKQANDLRLMSSGPRAGFSEIKLPAVQPGSSIMPGKINPCIPEFVMQICFEVYGKDQTITVAVDRGEIDLNIWEGIISKSLFESFELLRDGIKIFINKCIAGIEANVEICRQHAESSLALSTALSSALGYEKACELSKEAALKGRTIKELVIEKNLLTIEKAEHLLNPQFLTNMMES